MITTFAKILETVAERPRQWVAVAAAHKHGVLEAVKQAQAQDIAQPLLAGDRDEIERIADQIELDLSEIEIINEPDDLRAARAATLAVREGRADLLMKGHIHTDDFLRAILDKESGLRSGVIMSHVFLLEVPDQQRLLLVTDGAMNIAPDLVTKADIIMNAVYLSHLLGNSQPKVGVLAAVELVNPNMPATMDAAALSTMALRGQFPACTVDGPFALDNAISVEAARIKGIPGEVAGQCDILVVPNIEAGNILIKTFSFLCGGRTAGVLVGATAPVVLTSRADTPEAKMLSIATAVLMADLQRYSRLKIGKVHF